MRIAYGAAALILIGAGGALGAWSDSLRETPRPPPGPASLLGGFSALAVQILTMRADDAVERGDHAGALVQLDMIQELEPQLVRGADWIAHEIGVNMAGEEPDRDVRWGLLLEGLRVHDRCVRANPGDLSALVQRGTYVLQRFAAQPWRAERLRRETGRTPYEAALEDFRAVRRERAGDVENLDGLSVAALYAGRDAFVRGDDEAAVAYLREAAEAFDTTIARYTAGGVDPYSEKWASGLAKALIDVIATPPGGRDAAYRAFWATYGGPDGLPGLPEPEER